MKSLCQTVFGLTALSIPAVIAAADVPRLIHYQGKLRSPTGAAVNDAVEIRFRLYGHATSDTPLLFDETHDSIAVANGLFSVFIGGKSVGGVPDSALDAGEVWLGVAVGVGDELAPRTLLGSGPHAVKAGAAERLVRPGTFQTTVSVDGAGRVGVGADASTHQLEIFAESGDILLAHGPSVAGPPSFGPWQEVTASAWPARNEHASAVFDGKLWIFGGLSPGLSSDVWSSADGAAWARATASSNWEARRAHTALSYNGRMWVLGGASGSDEDEEDVWYSTNGIDWTAATTSAAWPGRRYHASVVHDNRMWILGGWQPAKQDVWYSTNGVDWTLANGSAWPIRLIPGCVSHNGSIWVLGGYSGSGYQQDVWSSTNGVNWTLVNSSAPWGPRSGLQAASLDGKLWVLGGDNGSGLNDVWSSEDGVGWTPVASPAEWGIRVTQRTEVYSGTIWVMGGITGSSTRYADVWRLISIPGDSPPVLAFSADGRLGIGTDAPGYPIELASGAHVTSGGVWTNASSRRLKDNIRDLSYKDAAEALRSLAPKRFNYRSDPGDECLGFIAEDVPALVAAADRQGLSSMDLTAVLTRVLQHQADAIKDLQREVKQQRAELDAIKRSPR